MNGYPKIQCLPKSHTASIKLREMYVDAYKILETIAENPMCIIYSKKDINRAHGIYNRINGIESSNNTEDYISAWLEADELIRK